MEKKNKWWDISLESLFDPIEYRPGQRTDPRLLVKESGLRHLKDFIANALIPEAERRKEREVLEEFKHFVASQEDESLTDKTISTRLCTLEWINSRLASLEE